MHFVHGTFAREAEWIHPESKMGHCVKECLGDETIIEPFYWSGRNSHTARQVAGQKLSEKIRNIDYEKPGGLQYIIAHSHGGNVVSYALSDPGVSAKIAAVICLGTPFINVHGRDLIGSRRLVQWILIACMIVVLIVTCVIFLQGFMLGSNDEFRELLAKAEPPFPEAFVNSSLLPYFMAFFFSSLAAVTGWLFSWPFIWLWKFFNRKGLPGLAIKQSEIIEQLGAKFGDTPLLIVDAKGDEAAWWLATISRVAVLPYKLWRPSRLVAYGMLALSLLTGFSLWISMNEGSQDVSLSFFLLMVPAILFVTSTTILAGLGWVFCLVFPAIFRSHALGFGRDDFFKNFIVEITSSERPEKSNNLRQETVKVEGKGLHHSRLYQEESVFRILKEWLKGVEK